MGYRNQSEYRSWNTNVNKWIHTTNFSSKILNFIKLSCFCFLLFRCLPILLSNCVLLVGTIWCPQLNWESLPLLMSTSTSTSSDRWHFYPLLHSPDGKKGVREISIKFQPRGTWLFSFTYLSLGESHSYATWYNYPPNCVYVLECLVLKF